MRPTSYVRWLSERRLSLRGKLIAIVGGGVFIPLILLTTWTTRRLHGAGEQLLRSQLDASLAGIERIIERNWQTHRGNLALLADNKVVREALRTPDKRLRTTDARFLEDAFRVVQPVVDEVVFTTYAGRARWRVAPDPGLQPRLDELPVLATRPSSRLGAVALDIPIVHADSPRVLGTMTVLLRMSALIQTPAVLGTAGASIGVEDSHGASLVRWDAPEGLSRGARTSAAPHNFAVVSRTLTSPPVRLVARAPIDPFVRPFEGSARTALLGFLGIFVATLVVAAWLTARATRSLRRLAEGADAVRRGNLDYRVDVSSADEIGRVGAAFNAMTQDLSRMLREASQRDALVAVGQFAAELAHEVRNPLTSVRLDLQRLYERLEQDPKSRDPLHRALSAIDRLNRTVTGALRVARSGSITLRPVQLGAALESAIQAAVPAFAARNIVLHRDLGDAATVWLRGDADALAQLFTNVLFNAAEAIDRRGRVSVAAAHENGSVSVMISDSGPGLPQEIMRQMEEPFHTTKRGGTGLGLTIARRIAAAHGGKISLGNAPPPDHGTVVTVTLPRDATPFPT